MEKTSIALYLKMDSKMTSYKCLNVRLRQLIASDDIAKSDVKYDNLFGSIDKRKEVTFFLQ